MEDVLRDPIMQYISTAVVNLEVVGHELLDVLRSARDSQPNLDVSLLQTPDTQGWTSIPLRN
jgi:hypothetical protein